MSVTHPETQLVALDSIRPAVVNDKVYKPIDPDDPGILALAKSIERDGLLEPLLVTTDYVILSGHRRYAACKVAGLEEVLVRETDISCTDDEFVRLLVSANSQRVKTTDEQVREAVILTDPEEAYEALLEHRDYAAGLVNCETVTLRGAKARREISLAKQEMVTAIRHVLIENWEFLPLSVRAVHYRLLNEDFYRNSKTKTRYVNDRKCYQDCSDLITRLRLNGTVPFDWICDNTRPTVIWRTHYSPGDFVAGEVDGFLKGYRRNLQQSQPNHIEVVVEKDTVFSILKPVTGRFCIPVTSARGFTSVPPRKAIFERYKRSGCEKMILIVCSDFDPEGEAIPETAARSLRDDFALEDIHCVKATLTDTQVARMNLPSDNEAKVTSSQNKAFVDKYGTQTYELEALEPSVMQKLLEEAIDSVVDHDALRHEQLREKEDWVKISATRETVMQTLKQVDLR